MRRDEALKLLARLKPQLVERYGISRLGIFGSTARDEATAESDVDIVVEMPPVSLWTAAGLRDELEALLGTPVDLVRYRETLNPRFKKRLDADATYV